VNAVTGVQVAADFAEHDHFASIDVRGDLSVAAYGNAIARQLNRAFNLAVDVERLGAGDFALNDQALADRRLFLSIQDGITVCRGRGRFGAGSETRGVHYWRWRWFALSRVWSRGGVRLV